MDINYNIVSRLFAENVRTKNKISNKINKYFN